MNARTLLSSFILFHSFVVQSVLFIHYNIINKMKKGNRIFFFFILFLENGSMKKRQKRKE